MTCEQCRQQLLPYLYDLLEPLERDQAAAHLQGCPECQTALQTARQQQGLLAEAVKEEHADIFFKAPSKATAASTAPTLVMQPPARRMFLHSRWSVAAAILLMLFGAGSVIAWTAWRDKSDALLSVRGRLARAKQDLSKSQNELNQGKGHTQKEIRDIQDEIDKLFNNWKQEETRTRKVLEEQGASLIIKGPQNPLAGANNSYQIEVRQDAGGNLAQQIAHAKSQGKQDQKNLPGVTPQNLNVRAVNQKTKQQVFEQNLQIQSNNQANFILPSDLPIKPGEDIALEFQLPGPDGKLITLTDNLKLASPEYVTHLATDRPLYRPGETVRFRSLTLERFSLKPAQEKFHLRFRIVGPNNAELYNQEVVSRLADPDGKPIKGPRSEELFCLGAGEFTLPATLANGQYTLFVTEVNERFNEEKRTFQVKPRPTAGGPRFNKDVQFHRNSYGAGDQVKMHVRVIPVEGVPPLKSMSVKVSARVVVDGAEVLSKTCALDAEGRGTLECTLPKQLQKGTGTVVLECSEGGVKETMVRDIPLVVRDLQVDFYAEGGDLIAGASNRVYFQARTPANKAAAFTGRIVDELDQEVARVQTVSDDKEPGVNQGLGAFIFTPTLEKNYRLRIDSPVGIERTIPLPKVKAQGVVLYLPQGVVENEIDVRLHNIGKARKLLIGAYCRGRMVDTKAMTVGADQPARVMLKPIAGVGGVYRITVFEWDVVDKENVFRPLAERLTYRKSGEKVEVAITSDRANYQPGDAVRLTLEAKNEKKAFVPALALVAVVDGSLLKLADEKATLGLPTHFLLTTEIRNPEDLENADVLLSVHPQAAQVLDLLLGCQGWRRFAEQNPQQFQERQQQVKQPNFLANTAVVTQFLESEQKQLDKLDQAFVSKAIAKQKELAEAEKRETGPAEARDAVAQSQANVQQIDSEVAEAEQRLGELRVLMIQVGLGAGLLALLLIGLYFTCAGLRRLTDGAGGARPWLMTGLGLLATLLILGAVGAFAFRGESLFDGFHAEVHNRNQLHVPVRIAPVLDKPANLPEPEIIRLDEQRVAELPKLEDKDKAAKKADADTDLAKKRGGPAPTNLAVLAEAANKPLKGDDPHDDRALRQQGEYQTLLLKQLGRRVQLPAVHNPSVVREYAHPVKPPADGPGRDRADTIYWHPALVMPDGKAAVNFGLPDAGTRFQVLVQSHTFDGRLGVNRIEIKSKLPSSK